MADEATTQGAGTATDAGAVGGAGAGATAQPSLEERLARLEADNRRIETENTQLRERGRVLDDTLQALGAGAGGGGQGTGGRSAGPGPGSGMVPADAVARVSERTGWTPEQVRAYWPVFETFVAEVGRPALEALGIVGDVVDRLDTRISTPDWNETFDQEIERTRLDLTKQGRFLSRKDVAALLRAKRMTTPEAIRAEATKMINEERARQASQGAAETEGGTSAGTQTAGPAAGKGGSDRLTLERFKKLPLKEQEAALADVPL